MIEKKERIVLSVFVFSLLAVVILSLLVVSKGGFTGKAVTEIDKNKIAPSQTTNELSCSDSDNGKNFLVKGNVNYCDSDGNCLDRADSCSGKKVIEQYCENNEARYEEHVCDFDCDGGVCVNLAKKFEYTNRGGGSGAGGETTTTTTTTASAETSNTYDLGTLTSEQTLEIAKNENIKFTIASSSYTLKLTEISESQITMSINSASTFTLNVGREQNLDLNSDSVADIYARLRSSNIVTNKIKLTFGPLS